MKIFVAHPYRAIPIADYRDALKSVERENKPTKFTFADEEITNQYILEKIERMIAEADLSLFDITTWNPNVTLELGIAVALKRDFYILFDPTKDAAEVPSDIRGRERIEYSSLTELRSKLAIVVRRHLQTQGGVSAEYNALRERVLKDIADEGPIRTSKVSENLGVDKAVVTPIIGRLREEGLIEQVGQRGGAKYKVATS